MSTSLSQNRTDKGLVEMRNLALGLTSIADNDILEEVSVRHVAKGPRSNNVSF